MFDLELESVVSTITGNKNPEIHHYNSGTHPGIKWYIKTICPGPSIINDDTQLVFSFWENLSNRHGKLIKLVKQAYDWNGFIIPGWWTIWLTSNIDVNWTWSRLDGFDYQLVDVDDGLKFSSTLIKQLIDNTNPTTDIQLEYCDKLNDIAEFLRTYTTDKQSRANRKNIRLIENDKIHPKTTD